MQADEDEKQNRFNGFPETYEPDPEYPGTCIPGTGKENRPFDELSLEHSIAPHAFFEAPFHTRWPANHPAALSPWERLEAAGRFVDEEDEDRLEKKTRTQVSKKTTVEKIDDAVETAVVEEKDPLFDDSSSMLLDAALGLDDEDTSPPPVDDTKEAPAAKALKVDSESDDDAGDEDFLLD